MQNKILYIIKTPVRWFRSMYNWTIRWSSSRHAPTALFSIAFIESSFFPIPPDVLLITMTIAQKKKWFKYAAICTIGSVIGALFGYFIGWALFETLGKFIVQTYNLQEVVQIIERKYQENAFFTVFTAAFTPIPYKAITISAGLFKISLFTLIIASIIGRAGRFFMVAGALRIFGDKIANSIEKYFDILSIIFVVLLLGGFLLLKFFWRN
ncbi:MAG: YqaA family protein [bacterium]